MMSFIIPIIRSLLPEDPGFYPFFFATHFDFVDFR